MTFKELINRNKWADVKENLLQIFPDQDELMDAYETVYHDLMKIEPVSSSFIIQIDPNSDEEYMDQEFEVNCISDEIDEETGEEDWTDIELESWEVSLGMEISDKTAEEFTELEIIVHCLNQMTMLGFTEEDIQTEMQEQISILEEFQKLSPEEQMTFLAEQNDWDEDEDYDDDEDEEEDDDDDKK